MISEKTEKKSNKQTDKQIILFLCHKIKSHVLLVLIKHVIEKHNWKFIKMSSVFTLFSLTVQKQMRRLEYLTDNMVYIHYLSIHTLNNGIARS